MKKNLTAQALLKKWLMGYPVRRHVLYGVLLVLLTLLLFPLALWLSHWQKEANASVEMQTTAPAIVDELLDGITDTAFSRKDTLAVGIDDPLQIIHPFFSTGDGEIVAVDLIFEPLVRIGLDGSPVAVLASSWEFDPVNHQLTFFLRRDHTFTDGRIVGMDDILFTYRCLMDNAYDGPLRGRLDEILAVEAGQKPDSIIFHLAEWVENPDYRQFTTGILKSDNYPNEPGQVNKMRDASAVPQGSGAYTLNQMQNDRLLLSRRPGYGGVIREITLQQVASEEKYSLLLKGELDIVRNLWDKRMQQRADNLPGYSFIPLSNSIDSYLLVNPEPLPLNIIQRPSQRLAVLLSAAGETLSDLQQDSLLEIAGKQLVLYYFQGIDDYVRQKNRDKAQDLADQLMQAGLMLEIKGIAWPDLVKRALDGDYDLLLLPATANSRLPENAVILTDPVRPDASALIVEYRSEVFIVSNRLAQLTINSLAHPYDAAAGTWTDRIENILVYNPDGTYWEDAVP
jgi:hypothetical protein